MSVEREVPAEETPPGRGRGEGGRRGRRGRPVLGAVSGLLFGVFLAITLQQFAVWPLDNLSVIGLPVLGLVLGVVLGLWSPFARGRGAAVDGRGDPVEA